jgi:hypothetical protein
MTVRANRVVCDFGSYDGAGGHHAVLEPVQVRDDVRLVVFVTGGRALFRSFELR